MRRAPRWAPSLVIAIVSWGSPTTAGGPAPAEGSEVIARVGPVDIRARDLTRRLGSMPAFQRASYGKTPDEIRRGVLDRVLVPEALLEVEARVRKLDESPELHEHLAQ